jgi:integrase
MPTTFKPVVYSHHRRANGSYNVKIRVTHNRKSRNLSTQVDVTADQLTRSLKIKDHRVLDALNKDIKRMRDAVMALGFEATNMDVDQVVEHIKRALRNEETFSLDFYEYGMRYATTRKAGTRSNYESALKAAKQYNSDINPDINDITARWLRGFIAFLQNENQKNLGPETVQCYVSKLSKIHHTARQEFNDEDARVIRIPLNPFDTVKAPTVKKLQKHKNISRELVQAIIDLKPESRVNSKRNVARDIFLLSFAMQGMNAIDLWYNVEEPAGFVKFTRRKTMDQHPVEIVVKIEPEARRILSRYEESGNLLSRLHTRYKSYKTFYSAVSDGMENLSKALGKKVTINSARHTWATLARNDAGVDKWTVHEALSHADRATAIDDTYIELDFTPHQKANRAVLDLFDWH